MKRLVRLFFAALFLGVVVLAIGLAFVDLPAPLRVIETPVALDGLAAQ